MTLLPGNAPRPPGPWMAMGPRLDHSYLNFHSWNWMWKSRLLSPWMKGMQRWGLLPQKCNADNRERSQWRRKIMNLKGAWESWWGGPMLSRSPSLSPRKVGVSSFPSNSTSSFIFLDKIPFLCKQVPAGFWDLNSKEHWLRYPLFLQYMYKNTWMFVLLWW